MATQLKKHSHKILILCLTAIFSFGCTEELNKLKDSRIIEGLKEALNVGTKNATKMLGTKDGYMKDPTVFIDLPDDAKTTIETASKVAGIIKTINNIPGVSSLIQSSGVNLSVLSSDLSSNLISAFNRGAEQAAPQAVGVFVKAIAGMSITDGKEILFSSNNEAATDYLYTNTSDSLTFAFSPIINGTISEIKVDVGNDSYNALTAWSFYADQNNKLANLIKSSKFQSALGLAQFALNDSQIQTINSIQTVNTDLGGYVVGKALGGIFNKIGKEEDKIRNDISARIGNDLLMEVFGELDKKKQK